MAAAIVILLIGYFNLLRRKTGKAHSSYLVSGNFPENNTLCEKQKLDQFMFTFTSPHIPIVLLKFAIRQVLISSRFAGKRPLRHYRHVFTVSNL